MNFSKQKLILGLVLTTLCRFTFAQSHPILGKFSVIENKGEVYISWTITAGSTCDGIQIYRSIDSVSFFKIGEIPGICGNISESQSYEFTDHHPVKNKVNYYRLEFGTGVFSQVISIEIIDADNNGYQIRPHPANLETKIYFENGSNQVYELLVFDLHGQKVLSSTGEANFFLINTSGLTSGLYFFNISVLGSLPTLHGKLLIQH